MRIQPGALGHQGVSPIIAEIILIAAVVAAMSAVAWAVISGMVAQERILELDIRLENYAEPRLDEDNTFDSLKVVLFHIDGDALGVPRDANDEFRVTGYKVGENRWDNAVPWDNWIFSDEANGFELGENAVGYLRHDSARIHIGDTIEIVVTDLNSNKIIRKRDITVENSMRYG